MNNRFEDYLSEECSIYASELVGPNAFEYEQLTEDLLEDPDFRNACLNRYRLETGDCS